MYFCWKKSPCGSAPRSTNLRKSTFSMLNTQKPRFYLSKIENLYSAGKRSPCGSAPRSTELGRSALCLLIHRNMYCRYKYMPQRYKFMSQRYKLYLSKIQLEYCKYTHCLCLKQKFLCITYTESVLSKFGATGCAPAGAFFPSKNTCSIFYKHRICVFVS